DRGGTRVAPEQGGPDSHRLWNMGPRFRGDDANQYDVEPISRIAYCGGGGASSSRTRLALGPKTLVEIGADRLHQRVDLAVEEVVGARDHPLLDHDAFLGLELVDKAADVLVRHDRILVAVNDHAGGGAGREKRKVVEVGGRGDRDEPLDFGPPHEQLHTDPGAEGEPGDPAAPGLRIDRL